MPKLLSIMIIFPEKMISKILDRILKKFGILAYSFFVNDCQMMVDIAGECA